jgi:hypothetical protein
MKKNALIFALILTVLSFLKSFVFEQNISITGAIVASVVVGLVTFFLMQLLLLPVQKSLDSIISDITGKRTDLIAYAPMNHSQKCFIGATGGIGCLYKDNLLFIPHKMNLFRKEVSISFSEVESITDRKIWKVFDTQLKITLKSGKVEKFVVDETTSFYTMLLDAIRK